MRPILNVIFQLITAALVQVQCDFEGCETMLPSREDMLTHLLDVHPSIMEIMNWCNACNILTFDLDTHTKVGSLLVILISNILIHY